MARRTDAAATNATGWKKLYGYPKYDDALSAAPLFCFWVKRFCCSRVQGVSVSECSDIADNAALIRESFVLPQVVIVAAAAIDMPEMLLLLTMTIMIRLLIPVM